MSIRDELHQRFQTAMLAVGIPESCEPHIAPSKKAGFGDFQANGAMGAAKAMKSNPREIAQKIVDSVDLEGVATKVEIAGPGFINIHLAPEYLAETLINAQPARKETTETVVVDYSGPNLAKEMHVGHLRSTIIGDAIVRVLERLGDTVIRQNHVGDWGTQFGMLIAALEQHMNDGEQAELALKDLESFYQAAKKQFDDEPGFADKAREYVVKLQSGDERMLNLWKQFRSISLQHSEEIYQKLGVTLNANHVYGESEYNNDLSVLVDELKSQGLATNDNGAQVVFLQELADKNDKPSPVIIQKQDGGYLYATTDLAALRYRANTLNAQRIMYFIDARQSLHLQQVFITARKAGFVSESVNLEHLAFGTMMGKDGKPFKTRTGGTVKLAELLEEAIERAKNTVCEKNPELTEDDANEIAKKVGIGAVKYADLCKTRTNDYIFDWDAMLSFEGNTGPYLQYAYTRTQSLFRKAGVAQADIQGPLIILAPQERALALKLLQFNDVIVQVAKDAMPHLLCTYLYEVASLTMSFYEACPILKDGVEESDKQSRLHLMKLVAKTLSEGLDLLGIETMDRM